MLKIYFVLLYLLFSFSAWSQPENGNNKEKLYIAPKTDAPPQSSAPKWIEAYIKQRERQKRFNSPEPNNQGVDFMGEHQKKYYQPQYELPKNLQTKNLQKEVLGEHEIDLAPLKGDHFFGDFVNNGKFLNIYCRDHGVIDGDKINILVNDRLVVENVYLSSTFKGFYIELTPGFNKIEFEAINQGSLGPNTAEFRILDENNNAIIQEQWQLLTGYKARFIIVKQ